MEAIKDLLESDAITEAMASEIQEAFDAKVKENKLAVTAELREEFAKKYEHDKGVMIEAIDAMVSEKLSEEMAEFHEDRKQLAEQKAKYALAMKENANLMSQFVTKTLANEISELHEDQKTMATKFSVLEDFVVEQLASEIAEFQEDKKDLAETKVRLVREAKAHFEKVRKNFIERSATAIENVVSTGLKAEISQLKEDIEAARKNDFGRKIFEAFSSEYMNSHLNEKSETAKLLKLVDAKNKQIAEAKEKGSLEEADKDKSEDELKENYRAIAERRVRLGLFLAEVGRKNNITVTQDDLNRAMHTEAARFPGQEAAVLEYFQKNESAKNELQAPIFEEKVVDFIVELAKVTDNEVSLEDLMKLDQPDDDEPKSD